jgi:hypothetical protein
MGLRASHSRRERVIAAEHQGAHPQCARHDDPRLEGIPELQRAAGNRAVAQLLARSEFRSPVAHATPRAAPIRSTPPAVQRKLAGTREALLSMTGMPGLGNQLQRSTYSKILKLLGRYEKRETQIVTQMSDWTNADRVRGELLKMLGELEELIDKWLQRHGTVSEETARERLKAKTTDAVESLDTSREEVRSHALIMLRSRVIEEQREVRRPDYLKRTAWNEERLVSREENKLGGGLNKLDPVEHLGGQSGVFIQDAAYEMSSTTGSRLGIPGVDANPGGRRVAMSRLAELLGADVIAQTDFAVQGRTLDRQGRGLGAPMRVLGVRQQLVEGSEARKLPMAVTEAERTNEAASFEDPVLQQKLNVLQIIDAIAGQLDRHEGNYLIKTQGGSVSAVAGIDLDMAFASGHTDIGRELVDRQNQTIDKHNFVGMPDLIDAQFAQTIARTGVENVRATLRGLITDDELEATCSRYLLVQQAISAPRELHVTRWTADTARRHDPARSYLGRWRADALVRAFDAHWTAFMSRATKLDWPPRFARDIRYELLGEVYGRVTEGRLTLASAQQAFTAFTDDLVNQPALVYHTDEYLLSLEPDIRGRVMEYWELRASARLKLLVKQHLDRHGG